MSTKVTQIGSNAAVQQTAPAKKASVDASRPKVKSAWTSSKPEAALNNAAAEIARPAKAQPAKDKVEKHRVVDVNPFFIEEDGEFFTVKPFNGQKS